MKLVLGTAVVAMYLWQSHPQISYPQLLRNQYKKKATVSESLQMPKLPDTLTIVHLDAPASMVCPGESVDIETDADKIENLRVVASSQMGISVIVSEGEAETSARPKALRS